MPPSIRRSIPLAARLSVGKKTPWGMSSIVHSRLVGVHRRIASTVAAAPWAARLIQRGESPALPGEIPLTRIGANSTASVLASLNIPPFTMLTMVEPA